MSVHKYFITEVLETPRGIVVAIQTVEPCYWVCSVGVWPDASLHTGPAPSAPSLSLVLWLSYSCVGDFALWCSYFRLWSPPQESFLELKNSDFSLQIWAILWLQTSGKWFLKARQRFSTCCPSPAAPDLTWPGSEKDTRSFQATECELLQTLKFKIRQLTLIGSIHILSALTSFGKNNLVSCPTHSLVTWSVVNTDFSTGHEMSKQLRKQAVLFLSVLHAPGKAPFLPLYGPSSPLNALLRCWHRPWVVFSSKY